MKRLLCVWLPNWPIQRLRIEKQTDGAPSKQGDRNPDTPIVLWNEDPRRGRLVVACCQRARSLGVRVSMPIAQAGEMVQAKVSDPQQSCLNSAAKIRPHQPQLDNESLEQIAGLFQQQISPLVAIEALDEKPWAGHPRHQSESLLCDIHGVSHLFGGEIGLLKAAQGLLNTMGLSGSMAIADSLGAAWALSHYSQSSISLREIAKTSGFAERNTTLTTQQRIEPLPVEALRISPATVATLSRLGINRIDQLLRLPRSGLTTRLGSELVCRIAQALGEVDEPLGVYRASAEHSQTLMLEYPTSDQKILADRIERLTKKVRAGLVTCQRGALRMACRLDLSAHPPLTLEIGLFSPTIDASHISGLLISRLETTKLASCVERLTVSVTLSGPLRSTQTSLFIDQSRDADSSLDCLRGLAISRMVDSLSGRLGRDAVLGVKIEDDPLPEKSFSVSPLAGNRVSPGKSASSTAVRSRKIPKSSSRPALHQNTTSAQHSCRTHSTDLGATTDSAGYQPSPDDAMRRPLSLLTEPVPLAVAFENGPFYWHVSSPQLPNRVRLDGIVHLFAGHWGPERIETGWWKGPSIRRDYYRIETDQGRWWWIFRNLASTTQTSNTKPCYRWMLHGRFA